MLGSGWFLPVSLSPFPLLPLLLWLAAGTGACTCFFRRLDDASSPPPSPHPIPEGSSPQIVWLLFGSSFFSSAPALLASRDTEQVNRAHHTLHVSVLVMCSVLLLGKEDGHCFLVMWYLAAFGSNSQRFSGELLVPLFRCCCRFSRDYSDPQSCSALADSCLKTLVAAEVFSSSSFFPFFVFFFLLRVWPAHY